MPLKSYKCCQTINPTQVKTVDRNMVGLPNYVPNSHLGWRGTK